MRFPAPLVLASTFFGSSILAKTRKPDIYCLDACGPYDYLGGACGYNLRVYGTVPTTEETVCMCSTSNFEAIYTRCFDCLTKVGMMPQEGAGCHMMATAESCEAVGVARNSTWGLSRSNPDFDLDSGTGDGTDQVLSPVGAEQVVIGAAEGLATDSDSGSGSGRSMSGAQGLSSVGAGQVFIGIAVAAALGLLGL